MVTSALRDTRLQAFNRVLAATPDAVESAVLHNQLVGETSLDAVLGNLAGLLGIGKVDALNVLGVSRSRKSRNPVMNVALLDRAYSALDIYARVASLIGTEHTPNWFQTPKQTLDGARPIDLLETRVGLAKLTGVVTALEDGSFL
ncbi:hypothetical protein BH24DEI1_BH24DEI1_18860 [soil metagenome]|nr:MbcA/ParS/Xre antitoxin family protein [Deinococcota bacterium]